jgi:glutamate:Na+ symporter, ESS family
VAITVAQMFVAGLIAAVLLLGSETLREQTGFLRRIFLPGSIVAGFVALALGPQVLGSVARAAGGDGAPLSDGAFPAFVLDSWRAIPGLLINVVFAALFLGKPIPGIRDIWLRAGPQVVFGQTLAWGQYVVGLLLALLVLTPFFGMHPVAGALIEIGFEGGHGTAAGMAAAFEQAGFPQGRDLALALATVGIVAGVLLGTVMVNWAIRRGRSSIAQAGEVHPASLTIAEQQVEITRVDERELESQKRMQVSPTDPLTWHLGIVGLAIAIGWVILEGLRWIEVATWGGDLFTFVPLFPLAMIGGVIIQLVFDRTGWSRYVSQPFMERISGSALDFVIVAALATLSLQAIGANLAPFLLLAVAGIAWGVVALLVIAPRVMPFNWFERGIGDFGQSMGVTVTGLLLMRMADPDNRSGALESFGYKQLLFEPIVGGGLFTGMSVGLIMQYGPVAVLALCAAITTAWLVFGLRYFGPMVQAQRRKGEL